MAKSKKIWIVCDNNKTLSIILYTSLYKANKHIKQYSNFKSEDCWIFNKKGTIIN